MNTNETGFYLSDNEQIIRNYECTKRFRLLGPAVIGYLTITNKRIVYHSHAKSLTGSSAVLSEVALDDFSGLRTSISSSFNWIFFLLFCCNISLFFFIFVPSSRMGYSRFIGSTLLIWSPL